MNNFSLPIFFLRFPFEVDSNMLLKSSVPKLSTLTLAKYYIINWKNYIIHTFLKIYRFLFLSQWIFFTFRGIKRVPSLEYHDKLNQAILQKVQS